MKRLSIFYKILFLIFCGSTALAQDVDDMYDLSLEELMDIEITSVSKKAEKLQNVASSIYVITEEDIRRSPHTRLADLLRTVPGYYAKSSSYLSVSSGIREEASSVSGTVLVLVDGVPVQSPMSSSFEYNSFDLPLDIIQRIEVIKGPGGTIYGANAATGIISIYTKEANYVRANVEYGSDNFMNADLTGGHTFSNNLNISGNFKYKQFGEWERLSEFDGEEVMVPVAGSDEPVLTPNRYNEDIQGIETIAGGAKLNYDFSEKTSLSLGGQFMQTNSKDFAGVAFPFVIDTSYVVPLERIRVFGHARLDHSFSENHSLFFQTSYSLEDNPTFNSGGGAYKTSLLDFEIQDNISFGFNTLTIGANYRSVHFDMYDIRQPQFIGFVDPQNTEYLLGAFVQDQIAVIKDKLNVTLGVKAEKWSLISDDFAISPSLRAAFTPDSKWTFWGAYSRSNTTPGYIQTNIEVRFFRYPTYSDIQNRVGPFAAPGVYTGFYGGPPPSGQALEGTYFGITNGESTDRSFYNTFEAGVRSSTFSKVYFETNFFYTQKEEILGAVSAVAPQPSKINPSELIFPLLYTNNFNGSSIGLETMVKFLPYEWLNLELSHAWFKSELEDKSGNKVAKEERPETPEHIVRLKSFVTLPADVEFSIFSFYSTAYQNGTAYDYVAQTYPTGANPGVLKDEDKADHRFVLDVKLEKKFLERKLGLYLWATDVLTTPFVEDATPTTTFLPKNTGRMYGGGVSYTIGK